MEKSVLLLINKLSVSILDKPVLYGIDLPINTGSIHAIMGPNGSGKSTLAYTLMGHPRYTVTSGSLFLKDTDITVMAVHERAKNGLFLALQYPCEIPGVSIASFLREAYMAIFGTYISVVDFQVLLYERCAQLKIDPTFVARGLNDGFSGGEKKRLELLQLLIMRPSVVILDEIDSGLDIDSLKVVADGIALARKENPAMGIIIITHYQRILNYITPDYVHVLCDGRIAISGDSTVAHMVESKGYDVFKKSII
jgi:Fe-S cluster assembly ATP-binding protein